MSNIKTNVMRILDKEKISYNVFSYDNKDGLIDGISVASKIGQPVERVFKTLVTKGLKGEYYVFIIPVAHDLDLKKAARSVGEKSIGMIKVSDITKVTGYVRGGCSPVGMKKMYKTIIDNSCNNLDTIIVSAGRIGYQIEIAPRDLLKIINGEIGKIIL